jgi:3-methylcrotonyl-CoA carboxylase alpha subunit
VVERVQLLHDDVQHEIRIEQASAGWNFSCAGRGYRVDAGRIDAQRRWIDLDGEHIEYAVVRDSAALALAYDGATYHFELPESRHDAEKDATAAGHPQAPMSGAVVAVAVAAGDRVAAGDTLMVIEAMKMEHAITAQLDATVAEVLFTLGDQVDEGETLVTLEIE